MNISVDQLFDIEKCNFKAIFQGVAYPWEVIPRIKDFLSEAIKSLNHDYERIDEFVWVGKGTHIESSAIIKGPAIIGCNCEIRHAAFIRENVIIGDEVVVGNSTELKNSLLFNKVQVPHFNYAGDSILGYKAHLGAGVILSNLKSNGELVNVWVNHEKMSTGLRKLGSLIGDHVEVGCNSVLNPGTIIGRNSIIYPLTSVRGTVLENQILKSNGEAVPRK